RPRGGRRRRGAAHLPRLVGGSADDGGARRARRLRRRPSRPAAPGARGHLARAMQSAAYAFVTFDLGCLSGDWPLAAEGARSAWDRLGALGEVGYRSTAGAALAWALVELGRTDEATEIVAEAERIASPDDQATTVLALIARSRIASSLGEHERAVALAQEAWDVISVTDDAGNQLFTLIGLAASLADAARFDEAAGVVERVVELAERRASPAFAERARTILAAAPQQ